MASYYLTFASVVAQSDDGNNPQSKLFWYRDQVPLVGFPLRLRLDFVEQLSVQTVLLLAPNPKGGVFVNPAVSIGKEH